MEKWKKLASELNITEEKLISKLETFLVYAQVQLANLEDVIEQKQYKKIAKFAHNISVKAAKLNLDEIYVHTEHIEILAFFKRDTDYMLLFGELQEALHTLHEEFVNTRELLPAR
jgi:hypothetical protein